MKSYNKNLILKLFISLLLLGFSFVMIWGVEIFHYQNTDITFPTISSYDTYTLDDTNNYAYSFTAKEKYLQSVYFVLINLEEGGNGELIISLLDENGKEIISNTRELGSLEAGVYQSVPFEVSLKPGHKYSLLFSQQNANMAPMLICNPGYAQDTDDSLICITYMNTASNWEKLAISVLIFAVIFLVFWNRQIEEFNPAIKSIMIIGSLVVQLLFMLPNIKYTMENIYLDPSWRYVLNIAGNEGYIFGKDLFFTYGPLGYICYLMNMTNNGYSFWIGLSVLVCVIFCHIYLNISLCCLNKYKYFSFETIIFASILCITAYAVNTWDNYMLYILILDVVVYSKINNNDVYFKLKYSLIVICNLLLLIMSFSKFSTFTSAVCFLVLFAGYSFLSNNESTKKRIEALSLFLPTVAIAPIAFVIYSHSFSAMINLF